MGRLTIDGQELEFAAGNRIIEVAHGAEIEVPFYCWHPRLSVVANCRMCLVEVEGSPKLLPACEARCRDGMVVHTRSARVLEAREAVMEFLLVNHPIDCPICDQAGECKLQDYYMDHDRSGTRFEHVKVPKEKAIPIGPQVMLDEERCINCTRCVRFLEEVANNPQLGQFDRGDRAVIGIFPGQPLDDPYSLNTVDICPVGALTSRDFRFKVRPWFLKSADTVCPGCARGCSMVADHYQNELQRLRPRDNPHVNQGWMCDAGRMSYKRVHDPETQITVPHARADDGRLVPIGWEEAATRLATLLAPHVGGTDGAVGLAVSAQLTTEGATAFVELAERVLPADTYAILGRPDGQEDELLRVADQNPNRAGAELVFEGYSLYDEGPVGLTRALARGAVKTLLMAGADHPNQDESWLEALRSATVVAWASNWNPTCAEADLVLPLASCFEQDGTFVNAHGWMQRIRPVLRPIGGRRTELAAAAFTAESLDAAWSLRTSSAAFDRLKEKSTILSGVELERLGPFGVHLEEAEQRADAAEPAAV